MNERVNKPAVIVLPPIPAKRYFTIGEVSELCGVKPHVLRYWEQEFSQLKPMKRRGNRRYYQHHEVLLIRRIRELLYDQGFTISGARNQLVESGYGHAHAPPVAQDGQPGEPATMSALSQEEATRGAEAVNGTASLVTAAAPASHPSTVAPQGGGDSVDVAALRRELLAIRAMLVS